MEHFERYTIVDWINVCYGVDEHCIRIGFDFPWVGLSLRDQKNLLEIACIKIYLYLWSLRFWSENLNWNNITGDLIFLELKQLKILL